MKLDKGSIYKINSAIRGYIHDDATRKGILSANGLPDDGSVLPGAARRKAKVPRPEAGEGGAAAPPYQDSSVAASSAAFPSPEQGEVPPQPSVATVGGIPIEEGESDLSDAQRGERGMDEAGPAGGCPTDAKDPSGGGAEAPVTKLPPDAGSDTGSEGKKEEGKSEPAKPSPLEVFYSLLVLTDQDAAMLLEKRGLTRESCERAGFRSNRPENRELLLAQIGRAHV